MELFLIILKNAALTLVVIPFVLLGQQILFKEEKQLTIKSLIIVWVIVIILVTIKEVFQL